MKRVLACVLALILLLAGCAQKPQEDPGTDSTTKQTLPAFVPEENPKEENPLLTYTLEGQDYYAVAAMGDGILLFSGDEWTTLTYLKEGEESVQISLSKVFLFPSPEYCTVTDRGIGYYDENTNELVFLDTTLTETQRVAMPEDMVCDPVLSEDWKYAYYFDDENLRSMELSTGICRILSDTWGGLPQVTGIHFGGSMLHCIVFEEDGSIELLIDAQTGQILFESRELWVLDTAEEWFFSQIYHTWGVEYVFGERGETQSVLTPQREAAFAQILSRQAWAVLCEHTETGFVFDLYDTESGMRKSSLIMDGLFYTGMTGDTVDGRIWILTDDMQTDAQILYGWDPEQSLTEDTSSYIGKYHTAQDPDEQALAQVAADAKALGEKYGVRVLVYTQATDYMPADFVFESEHAVQAYRYYLPILEEALSAYPDGFLKKLGKSSGNGRLTVSLVKYAWGDSDMGAVEQADGVQFWDNGNAYLTLAMNDQMLGTVYHELYHAIDTYVLTETLAYDFWDQLNPDGFQYFGSYQAGQANPDSPYLNGETRAFVDEYSMSYPKEDRARIMEYAMQEGMEDVFASDAMQAKLRTVCAGIREAFGLKKEPTIFLWEQYLNAPMI